MFSCHYSTNFRQFYSTYPDRLEKKSYPMGSEFKTVFSPQRTWPNTNNTLSPMWMRIVSNIFKNLLPPLYKGG